MKKEDKQTKTKINIHEEYWVYHEKYKGKYGPKTVVLMQVGSFHECYSTDTQGPNLFNLSELLNIVCTRKDKSINTVDEKNPYMLGFPSVALSKFLKILIDNQYTVIVIDQTTPPPNPLREVTGIYSPSTFIENVGVDNRYLMSLYIEINTALNSTKSNISVGMCAVDSSTGQVHYYESHGSGIIDENEALEEAQRFYHYYRPVELLVYQINNTGSTDKLTQLVNKIDILPNQIMFTYDKINPNYNKLTFQNTLLKKVYNECGMVSPIEFLDLSKYPYAILSMISAFDYIHQHNENLIKELKKPLYFNEHKYMLLGNNAQYQLNIIDYYNWERIDSKFQSLNAVVNNCVTPMGKRTLKHRLCAPYTNTTTITRYYELTDKILNNSVYQNCRDNLSGICDLDKLLRKLSIKFIQPYELYNICLSFDNIVNLIQLLVTSDMKNELLDIFGKKQIKVFNEAIKYLNDTFQIDKLKINNLVEIKESFYQKGIHKEIDEVEEQIFKSIGFIDKLASVLEQFDQSISLSTKHNDRDGYYLSTTKIRAQKLKQIIEDSPGKTIKITDNISINKDDLIFTYQTNTAKITYPGLSDHSDELEELYNKLNILIKNAFYNDTLKWYNKYSIVLRDVVNMVVEFDLISNNAFTSVKYHYVKPKIVNKPNNSQSFINAKNLRHPIIERLIDYEYVPHDACLNDNILGNMIYGVNSSGKSSLMKAIGTTLIMAQCGLFVPADSFEYGIFDSLYTRISGNDNLFKGQSSFIVEMNELRCILKRANEKSLIIGDEICRGTEYLSANAIVAATVLKLVDIKAKFIFATHLHDLASMEKIKSLSSIKFFYLSVEKVGDELVFNRKMIEGTGEQIYGITIAKYILDDPVFIITAIELKNELLEKSNISTKIINEKKSNYNKDIFMDECSICGCKDGLESHHINFQKDFINTKYGKILTEKKHIVKDSQANLISLCQKCHDDLHGDKLSINKKVKSTKGTIIM